MCPDKAVVCSRACALDLQHMYPEYGIATYNETIYLRQVPGGYRYEQALQSYLASRIISTVLSTLWQWTIYQAESSSRSGSFIHQVNNRDVQR